MNAPRARRDRVATPGLSWILLAGALAAGALVVALLAGLDGSVTPDAALLHRLDWEPALAWAEPWRLWTSAWVHWSLPHLLVNLAGAGVVGLVGWRARAAGRDTLAWALAWPLTQALLALPSAQAGHGLHPAGTLAHYGGLSGVLHAGAVVLGLALALPRARSAPAPTRDGLAPLTPAERARHRLVGLGLVAGTLAKVLLEAPWDPGLRPSALLGIQVAPLAHACGVVAGAVAWAIVTGVSRATDALRASKD